MGGHGTKWRRNIAENFNRLSRVYQRYRRQTDGRAMTYSERERDGQEAAASISSINAVIYTRCAMKTTAARCP